MEKILKETWKQAFRKAGWIGEVPPVALPYQTESERIIKFIEFHDLESVQGLRDPLTKEDASWLLSRYPAGVIEDTLLDMENFPKLKKKYKSVKLTLNNWAKKRMKDYNDNPNTNVRAQYT